MYTYSAAVRVFWLQFSAWGMYSFREQTSDIAPFYFLYFTFLVFPSNSFTLSAALSTLLCSLTSESVESARSFTVCILLFPSCSLLRCMHCTFYTRCRLCSCQRWAARHKTCKCSQPMYSSTVPPFSGADYTWMNTYSAFALTSSSLYPYTVRRPRSTSPEAAALCSFTAALVSSPAFATATVAVSPIYTTLVSAASAPEPSRRVHSPPLSSPPRPSPLTP
jgi:hypothetical protein